jgi:hypothetical protein
MAIASGLFMSWYSLQLQEVQILYVKSDLDPFGGLLLLSGRYFALVGAEAALGWRLGRLE